MTFDLCMRAECQKSERECVTAKVFHPNIRKMTNWQLSWTCMWMW